MSKSRWRLPAAGATVVVGGATGVLTNLITSRWSIALAVGLGVLLVIGIVLQVALTAGDDSAVSGGDEKCSSLVIRQAARAHNRATVIQPGGNVTISPDRGSSSPADGQEPAE